MVNPIDFGGHSSNVKVTMGIFDKCWVRGDATLCVVIFIFTFYAPGLKGPPGASSVWIVRLSVRLSVCVFVCP